MHRTIDDYDSMAKREMIKAKQEKAQMSAMCVLFTCRALNPLVHRRVQKFRSDYADLRNTFETLKNEAALDVRRSLFRRCYNLIFFFTCYRKLHHNEPTSSPHPLRSYLPPTPAGASNLHIPNTQRYIQVCDHSPKNTRNPHFVAQHPNLALQPATTPHSMNIPLYRIQNSG
jgi:hypothetical protein